MSVFQEKPVAEGGGQVRRRRRRWSEAQKRQIVAEIHEPGVSVPMVAQRYNLNANQVFRWRRLLREPECAGTGRFVPVVVGVAPDRQANAAPMPPPCDDGVAAGAAAGASATGRMEIVLPGERRVIVDRSVDPSALARVIAVLERR